MSLLEDPTVYMKQGDTLPACRDKLKKQDPTTELWSALDLTGCTVEFHLLKPDGTTVVTGAATAEDAANGVVRWDWVAGNLNVAGTYYREWQVTDGASKILTVPNDTKWPVVVEAQIA